MKAYIKSYDSFGSPVSLNFNKSAGPAHKTLVGGIVSLAILLAIQGIILIECYEIYNNQNATIKHHESMMKPEEMKQIVPFNDTGIQFLFMIYGMENNHPKPLSPEDVKEYVNVTGGQYN